MIMSNIIIVLALFFGMSTFDSRKGVAMAYMHPEDILRTNAGWYYIWDTCQKDKCVPMSYQGEDPNLPSDYSDYILLFNEPNSQTSISPTGAVDMYVYLSSKYPNAKWVVGNTIFWGNWQTWLKDFKDICQAKEDCVVPKYWGVHVYIRQANQ